MESSTAQSAPPAGETPWHAASVDEVARLQEVDPAQGLSSAAAEARLARYGANVLAAKKKESGWQAFLRSRR